MEKVKIKYLGVNPTRISTEKGGAKVDVKTNGVVEVNKDVAEETVGNYKNVWAYADGAPSSAKPKSKKELKAEEEAAAAAAAKAEQEAAEAALAAEIEAEEKAKAAAEEEAKK